MTQRLEARSIDPRAHQAVLGLERYVRNSGLDPRLYELVKIRASQLNGCAYCLDMHNRDARKGGEGPAASRRAVGVAGSSGSVYRL